MSILKFCKFCHGRKNRFIRSFYLGSYLGIPAGATIEKFTEGTGQISSLLLPKFSPGFDFTDTAPGRTLIYNKNTSSENVVLYHIGYPTPANIQIRVTATLVQ